ncbi:MAG: hypothetical protein LBC44_00705 [Mycoplasmataceae bacterium]|nr:hypothetical protein [Mycoplasmataceae bacterium]
MFNWIGDILNAIFSNMLYGCFVLGPLYILNTIYWVFNWMSTADLGSMILGNNGNSLEWNVNSPVFTWMFRIVLFSTLGCALLLSIAVLTSVAKHEQVKWGAKIKWVLIVFTSIIIFPLGFVLLNGIVKSLATIIIGGEETWFLYEPQVTQFIDDVSKGIDKLAKLTGMKDIPVVDIDSDIHELSYENIFSLMNQSLAQIASVASLHGLTNIQNEANDLMKTVGELNDYFSGGNNSLFNQDLQGIQSILGSDNWTYDGDKLRSKEIVYEELQPYLDRVDGAKASWTTIINGFTKIGKEINIPTFREMDKAALWIGTVEFQFNINKDLIPTFSSTTNFKSLNAFLLGVNLKDDAGNSMHSLWNLICTAPANTKWEYEGAEFEYVAAYDYTTGNDYSLVSLNDICSYSNSVVRTSFSLVIQIYQMITERTDTNWTINRGAEVKISGTIIGFVSIVMVGWILLLFLLFSVRRISEVLICFCWLTIAAMIGIVDEGQNFNTIRRVTIAKMFTSVIIYMAFQMSISITAIVSKTLTIPGDIGNAFGKIAVTVGCLLGGYGIANWIGVQYGDTNGLGETMRDLGVIKGGTMTGMAAGGMAMKLGASGASGVNKLSGGKIGDVASAGVNKLHDVTGNRLRSGEWKSNAKLANVQNAAASQGIGSFTSQVDKNGKVFESFQLNPELANAGKLYKSMMGSKGYDYKSEQKLAKANKLEKQAVQSHLGHQEFAKQEKLNKLQAKANKVVEKRRKE